MDGRVTTYIRMPPDLLNGLLIKVARVAHERACDIVGMLQPGEQLAEEWLLRSLPELRLASLLGGVKVVDPFMVSGSKILSHMILELDHIAVGNLNGILRRVNGSRIGVLAGGIEQDR